MDSLRADISLLPNSEGGRSGAIDLSGRYTPHLRVDGGEYLGVALRSDTAVTLDPGESGLVTLDLLYDIDYGALAPGARFEILEGNRRIGAGVVL
ncbi:hypothetical protein [Arthrobacter sp. fls2-241-R2A-172]|uniref:hypothetical protein n=1 Tax=Arthrobacter sp. fls2-241-R2A-172 TaxID=3040325 RepID=UPI00254EF524|nr:hypothetical protein [Arthrobacter sp. fls2-241-R2A-172]